MAIKVIKTRSPYYWINSSPLVTKVELLLFMYEGIRTTDRPLVPTYTLSGTPINGLAYFDVASIVKNYFEYDYDGSDADKVFYVDIQEIEYVGASANTLPPIQQFIALSAYSNFEENQEPLLEYSCLLGNNVKIRVNYSNISLEEVKIPVLSSYTTSVDFYRGNTLLGSVAVEDAENNEDEIKNITYIKTSQDISQYPTRAVVNGSNGGETSNIILEANPFIDVPASNKLTYVNKNGCYADFWLYGTAKESLKIESSTYKRKSSIGANLSEYYSLNRHSTSVLSKNSSKSVKIGSGFYDEDYRGQIEQILLSEKVWLNDKPIIVANSSIQYKNRVEDRLLSFDLEFEYANNTTNIGY